MRSGEHGRGITGRQAAGVALAFFLLASGWALWLAWGGKAEEYAGPTLSAVGALTQGTDEGFARALEPRAFQFPADHGPHPEFRTEWWYLTGNLTDQDGAPWAYHLTIFRTALTPEPPEGNSVWATNQIYMAHLAVTDGDRGRHRAVERLARGAVGLAGAQAAPFRVWVEDWQMGSQAGGLFPLRVQATDGDLRVDLVLDQAKGPVLQGVDGLSQKGPDPGDASYYYSFPRIRTQGRVSLGGVDAEVQGESWMDREWSTSALADGQVGWDWFSLQLQEGGELMFYHIRRADGSPDALSKGLRIYPDGRTRLVTLEEVSLEVTNEWASPVDGTRYPSGWLLKVPKDNLSLRLTPLIPNQEQLLSVRYWEGAVRVEGTLDGGTVTGRGFAELTGYAPEGSGISRDSGG
ncbi:MAG: lipocalin-like domain-containing protein [Gemmatimonadota bacterium]